MNEPAKQVRYSPPQKMWQRRQTCYNWRNKLVDFDKLLTSITLCLGPLPELYPWVFSAVVVQLSKCFPRVQGSTSMFSSTFHLRADLDLLKIGQGKQKACEELAGSPLPAVSHLLSLFRNVCAFNRTFARPSNCAKAAAVGENHPFTWSETFLTWSTHLVCFFKKRSFAFRMHFQYFHR